MHACASVSTLLCATASFSDTSAFPKCDGKPLSHLQAIQGIPASLSWQCKLLCNGVAFMTQFRVVAGTQGLDMELAMQAAEVAGTADAEAAALELLTAAAAAAPQLTLGRVLEVVKLASGSSKLVRCCLLVLPHC